MHGLQDRPHGSDWDCPGDSSGSAIAAARFILMSQPINRPISAHSQGKSSLRTIAMILVRRLERRSSFWRGASGGNERRNISKAC